MPTEDFGERLTEAVRQRGAAIVGIDPQLERIGPYAQQQDPAEQVLRFSLDVIEAISDIVAVIKPQSAFFEQLGAKGVAVLAEVIGAARERGLIVLLDGKRGDIGSTASAYARAHLDPPPYGFGADAVTLSPYLGPESLAPYEQRLSDGKGIFVLVRTSNPGAASWQYDTGIAARVAEWINARCPGPGFGPVGAVIGATVPSREVADWRRSMPKTWFLVPGFGAQGAGPEDVRPHFATNGLGALISSSREVLYPASGFDADPRSAIRARAATFADTVRQIVRTAG